MKYLPVLLLAGCASGPPPMNVPINQAPIVQLSYEPKVQQMSRNEVIQATIECENNGLRASPIFTKRIVGGYTSDIVIDVVCLPRRLF